MTQIGSGGKDGKLIFRNNTAMKGSGGGLYSQSFLLVMDPVRWSGNFASPNHAKDLEVGPEYRDSVVVQCPIGTFFDKAAILRLKTTDSFAPGEFYVSFFLLFFFFFSFSSFCNNCCALG